MQSSSTNRETSGENADFSREVGHHFWCFMINTDSRSFKSWGSSQTRSAIHSFQPGSQNHPPVKKKKKHGWASFWSTQKTKGSSWLKYAALSLPSLLLECLNLDSLTPSPSPPPPSSLQRQGGVTWLWPWPWALPDCFVWSGWRSDVFGHYTASH